MSVEAIAVELECTQCGIELTDDSAIETLFDGVVCEDCESSDYVECADCNGTVHCHRTHTLANGEPLCETCFDTGDYTSCNDCSGIIATDESFTAYDEYDVCNECSDGYMYCDECGMYVSDNDSDHDHTSYGCMCESAFPEFRIRNDGFGMLANDTRTIVALPSGVVSSQGMTAIVHLIRSHANSLLDDYDARVGFFNVSYYVGNGSMDSRWQTKDGNFTKRLSRWAYKNCHVKLPPEIVSEIGNIARAHSNGQDYGVEFTRQLNMSAAEFGHSESCYWQSYSVSRCALKANGGIGIRTFGEYGNVTGRAWIIPMDVDDDNGNFTATDNAESPDAFIVFNGYGDLSGYAPARIMAHMAGMTYRKVQFYGTIMNDNCDTVYVNGDMGYLVAPEAIATDHTDGIIRLSLQEC